MPESMDEANRRDMALERDCRAAVRALDAVLAHGRRLAAVEARDVIQARNTLASAADLIVAVWD